MDFVNRWSDMTEIAAGRFIRWLGVSRSKFYDWRARYGKVNEHNGWIPRDFWLEDWEKQKIIEFFHDHPLEGYRRLADFVEHYNTVRLHSAIGFVAPKDKLEGRDAAIFAKRDRKLEAAREIRRQRRNGLDAVVPVVVS